MTIPPGRSLGRWEWLRDSWVDCLRSLLLLGGRILSHAKTGSRLMRMEHSYMKKSIVAYVLVLLTFSSGLAQQTNSAWLTENDRTKLESLRSAGFEALFNLDYEAARKNFRELAESLPSHPAGPQFLPASLW